MLLNDPDSHNREANNASSVKAMPTSYTSKAKTDMLIIWPCNLRQV